MGYIFTDEQIINGTARLTTADLDALDYVSYAKVVDIVNDWYQTRLMIKRAAGNFDGDFKRFLEKQEEHFKSKMYYYDANEVDRAIAIYEQLKEAPTWL